MTKLITFMAGLEFSGAPLIIMLFIITILIGILIPSFLNGCDVAFNYTVIYEI